MKKAGFTLVELLVTIVIIGILAALAMGGLNAARDTARVAKTKATIAKLNELVMERWESYRTRRVAFIDPDSSNPKPLQWKVAWAMGLDPSHLMLDARTIPRITRNAKIDLMRLEMPERRQDILSGPCSRVADPNAHIRLRAWLNQMETNATFRQFRYIEAEIFYRWLTLDAEARERFSDSEIADTDGDGALEFVDGWGNPIMCLRWPSGFRSEIQTGNAVSDHDPLDTSAQHLQDNAFRLVPLIYSAGPDGIYDIGVRPGIDYGAPAAVWIDPYAVPVGEPIDSDNISRTAEGPANGVLNHHDNIHNHSLAPR